jgi:hypothetical protein
MEEIIPKRNKGHVSVKILALRYDSGFRKRLARIELVSSGGKWITSARPTG